jgi:hypothetical protein
MNMDEAMLGGAMLLVIGALSLVGLAVAVFYLLTLQKCLNRVSPANRAMNPPMVWLNLIPLFNLVWGFITVLKIAESLVKEAQVRGLNMGDGGKMLGLAYLILGICGIIPVLGVLCSLGALVCWIMYWVKIAGYSNQLAAPAIATPVASIAPGA